MGVGLHSSQLTDILCKGETTKKMTEEAKAVAVEEAPAAEEEAAVETPSAKADAKVPGKAGAKAGVKAKNEKKPAKAKTTPSHPTYSAMIVAAVGALKDRTGSSRQAILKYICANYKVDSKKAATQIRLALKRMTTGGELRMAKDKGKGAGCYKLASSETADKPAKPAKKAKKAKKAEKKEKKPAKKKSAAKKGGGKKSGKKTAKRGKK